MNTVVMLFFSVSCLHEFSTFVTVGRDEEDAAVP